MSSYVNLGQREVKVEIATPYCNTPHRPLRNCRGPVASCVGFAKRGETRRDAWRCVWRARCPPALCTTARTRRQRDPDTYRYPCGLFTAPTVPLASGTIRGNQLNGTGSTNNGDAVIFVFHRGSRRSAQSDAHHSTSHDVCD